MAYALVFPGQGAQSVGMLDALAEAYPVVRETFAEASSAIDLDLWRLASQGPAELLDATEQTQPVLLTASIAALRALASRGALAPAAVAGHSLGEYTALVAAGTLSLCDAVRLVRRRGLLMAEAVPAGQGAMAAILGLDDDAIAEACAEAAGDEVVSPANFNAPGQIVIAGHSAAVERAIEGCKARGAKRAMALRVSGPFHSALMAPAAEAFRADLEAVSFQSATVPVYQNVTAAPTQDPTALRDQLLVQLSAPVQWTRSVQAMGTAGLTAMVECGPGAVLATMVRRIDKAIACHATGTPEALGKTREALEAGL
ncbi:MAG: ACP S-malonyltransferase [Pseudomonadales bacterium]|nr:ACP S-malonyltransferase [Pseudomonadales bacterium]